MLSSMIMRQQARCLLQLPKTSILPAASQSSPAIFHSQQKSKTTLTPSALAPYISRNSAIVTSLKNFSTSPVRADHAKIWAAEKIVSAAMVPACIVPFLYTTPLTDAVFCTLAVLHVHWGVEALVVDYIRPVLFGGKTLIPKICQGLVWVLSAVTLGGLYYFNYTDVGIIQALKMLWKL